MKRNINWIILIGFLFLAAVQAGAAVVKNAQPTVVMCRNSDSLRVISVELDPDQRCKTIYSKGGVSQIMAGSNVREKCDQVLKNIWSNLEIANWSCHEVKQGRVSFSVED